MINFDDVKKEIIKKRNPNWAQLLILILILTLIIKCSGSTKINSLFNLISHEPDIDNIYMLKIHMKQNINF